MTGCDQLGHPLGEQIKAINLATLRQARDGFDVDGLIRTARPRFPHDQFEVINILGIGLKEQKSKVGTT